MCLRRCEPSRREGHLGRFGVFGPSWETPPASNHHIRLRSRKMGGSIVGRKARIYKITSAWPATIAETGEGGRQTNNTHPREPWRGYRGGVFSLILISLFEVRSTRFEARGLGGFAGWFEIPANPCPHLAKTYGLGPQSPPDPGWGVPPLKISAGSLGGGSPPAGGLGGSRVRILKT